MDRKLADVVAAGTKRRGFDSLVLVAPHIF
jgi:hypothetical protein